MCSFFPRASGNSFGFGPAHCPVPPSAINDLIPGPPPPGPGLFSRLRASSLLPRHKLQCNHSRPKTSPPLSFFIYYISVQGRHDMATCRAPNTLFARPAAVCTQFWTWVFFTLERNGCHNLTQTEFENSGSNITSHIFRFFLRNPVPLMRVEEGSGQGPPPPRSDRTRTPAGRRRRMPHRRRRQQQAGGLSGRNRRGRWVTTLFEECRDANSTSLSN